MYFVGKLESVDAGWAKPWEPIAQRWQSGITPGEAAGAETLAKLKKVLSKHGKAIRRGSSGPQKRELVGIPELHKRAERPYAADYDCFGFNFNAHVKVQM